MKINALNLDYKTLNRRIYSAVNSGKDIKILTIDNVNGQRFIASGLDKHLKIGISGVPGNDLGSFMNGPTIIVDGNGQDAVGNTMSGGKIVINGHAGDAVGYSMRGGKIFIRGNAGYRTGIHMKEYKESVPVIVIGGRAKDFLGEYMAGGIIIVLGHHDDDERHNVTHKATILNLNRHKTGRFCCGSHSASGMHGGAIYIPHDQQPPRLPKGVRVDFPSENELKFIHNILNEFADDMKSFSHHHDARGKTGIKNHISRIRFIKIHPASRRPYGNLYAY